MQDLARPLLPLLVAVLSLFSEPAAAQTPAAPPADKPVPWWERLTFSGDLRARYEGFYQEDVDTRHRQRFRARLGLRAPITDTLTFGFRLASGDAADVASTNQTLEGFFTRKPINIDQVFMSWAPAAVKGLTLGYGKYPYPVMRTQLVWDDDINWEGAFEQWSFPAAGGTVRLAAAQSPLRDLPAGRDSFLFAEQAQFTVPVGAHQVQASIASYGFREIDGLAVAQSTGAVRSNTGNALRLNDAGAVVGFVSRFHIVDLIGQATIATASRPYPLQVIGQWTRNVRGPSGENDALMLQTGIGRAASPGTGALSYAFERIEREALLAAFGFSDVPGTNVRAHILQGSFMPRSRVNLDTTLILTRRLDVAAGTPNELLKRLQVDARVTF